MFWNLALGILNFPQPITSKSISVCQIPTFPLQRMCRNIQLEKIKVIILAKKVVSVLNTKTKYNLYIFLPASHLRAHTEKGPMRERIKLK